MQAAGSSERRLRVFDNRVLRRLFGRKKNEVTGEWRKPHNEERNDLYSSPTIFRVIKLGKMTWAGHAARIGKSRGVHRVLVGNLRERDHLEDPGVDRRIILRWILRKRDVGTMYRIYLAQERDRWRALVKAVMKFRGP